MKEHPIIFSGPMVCAILDGKKTMTRRVIKPQPVYVNGLWLWKNTAWDNCNALVSDLLSLDISPYQPGNHLWVRETWGIHKLAEPSYKKEWGNDGKGKEWIIYRADGECAPVNKWRPSIYMPRWAVRITLEITDVKIERVQDITEEDTNREGFAGGFPSQVFPEIFPGDIEYYSQYSIPQCFGILWDSLNLKRGYGWDTNPFVRCTFFKKD